MTFQLVKAGNYPRALMFLDRLRRMRSTPEGVIEDSNLAAKREREASGRTKVTFSQADGVAGTVAPPAAFLVNIRVFEDGSPQVLQVRLRVTVEGAVAKFHVRIHRASELLRESFAELVAEVKERAEVPVFVGTPEA
jgi:hypothetical protein